MKVRRVIGAANKRTGGDVSEAFPARNLTVKIKLFWSNVAHNRQVFRRRTKILAQGQDLAADFAEIVTSGDNR